MFDRGWISALGYLGKSLQKVLLSNITGGITSGWLTHVATLHKNSNFLLMIKPLFSLYCDSVTKLDSYLWMIMAQWTETTRSNCINLTGWGMYGWDEISGKIIMILGICETVTNDNQDGPDSIKFLHSP